MLLSPVNFRRLQQAALGLACLAGGLGSGCAEIMQRASDASQGPAIAVVLTPEENQVFLETNAFRRANGLPELKPDGHLIEIARLRSQDMAKRKYFSHANPDGGEVYTQMREAHIAFAAAGENLAQGSAGKEPIAHKVMETWQHEVAHRANLLHPDYTKVGIGMALAADGKRYYTELFTD